MSDKKYDSCVSCELNNIRKIFTEMQVENEKLQDELKSLYAMTRSGPELWDTDGICFILDKHNRDIL